MERSTKIRISPPECFSALLPCRAVVVASDPDHTVGVIRRHRKQIGSRVSAIEPEPPRSFIGSRAGVMSDRSVMSHATHASGA
jgi:hypothetical protein